jgi:hypothetical protein
MKIILAQLNKSDFLKMLLIIASLSLVFILISDARGRIFGISRYITLGVLWTVGAIIALTERTVSKIAITEDSEKLLLFIKYRFKKDSKIEFNLKKLEFKQQIFNGKTATQAELHLEDEQEKFKISTYFKGINKDDIKNIFDALTCNTHNIG